LHINRLSKREALGGPESYTMVFTQVAQNVTPPMNSNLEIPG